MVGPRISPVKNFARKSYFNLAALGASAAALAMLSGCIDVSAPSHDSVLAPMQDNELAVSAATTTTIQAEKAAISGAVVASSSAGYTGTGFVDYKNPSGDYVDWTVSVPTTGTYTMTFRYANASNADRPLKITNGSTVLKASQDFPPTGSWTTWKTVSFSASFSAGTRHVRATAIGKSGPNMDNLVFSGPGGTTTPPPTTRKANLTWFTSYPAPGSEECIVDNGCAYEGLFAALPNKMSLSWVKANNIIAVHEKYFNQYKLKTFHITQGSHAIDAIVYDECADSDCGGCCTQNANSGGVGFLIDMETYTTQRFGANDGVVNWYCKNCN